MCSVESLDEVLRQLSDCFAKLDIFKVNLMALISKANFQTTLKINCRIAVICNLNFC